MTVRRLFTLEEANDLIPEIERRLALLHEKRERHARNHDFLLIHQLLSEAEKHRSAVQAEVSDVETEIMDLEASITGLEHDVRDIHTLGCIIRNIDRGYVDFPAVRGGRRIYFCWKWGEKKIGYYHGDEGDMNNRLPLDF